MKKLRETRLLEYCEGPSVIEAQGEDGRRYLCDMVEPSADGERYLVVPVTDAQIEGLNNGTTCLRCEMEASSRDEWYLSVPQWDFRKPFAIERQRGAIRDLPGPEYFLTGAWND